MGAVAAALALFVGYACGDLSGALLTLVMVSALICVVLQRARPKIIESRVRPRIR
jgi:hypothetical protein